MTQKNPCIFHRLKNKPFGQNFRPKKIPETPPPPISKILSWAPGCEIQGYKVKCLVVNNRDDFKSSIQRGHKDDDCVLQATPANVYGMILFLNLNCHFAGLPTNSPPTSLPPDINWFRIIFFYKIYDLYCLLFVFEMTLNSLIFLKYKVFFIVKRGSSPIEVIRKYSRQIHY